MNQANRPDAEDELEPEYDLSGGVRGKYYERYRRGTNLILLDPDVAAAFPDPESVNQALRLLMELARRQAADASNTARRS